MNLVHSLGITRRELIPVATNVNAAGANGLNLVGGMFITIASTDQEGNIRETRQMCYISEKIFVLYLSEQACKDLGVLQEDFPNIPTKVTETLASSSGTQTRTCSCPDRTPPPSPPSSLPYPATESNRGKLHTWIENYYASSAFRIYIGSGMEKKSYLVRGSDIFHLFPV